MRGNHPRQKYYQIWKEGGVLWNSPRYKSWILPRKQLLCSKNASLFIPAWLILFILEKIRGCWWRRLHMCVLSRFSCVWLYATLWTVARQAPLSMGFSWQEYCSGLSCPPPGDLPDPGMEPLSLNVSCIDGWVVYHQCHLRSPRGRLGGVTSEKKINTEWGAVSNSFCRGQNEDTGSLGCRPGPPLPKLLSHWLWPLLLSSLSRQDSLPYGQTEGSYSRK